MKRKWIAILFMLQGSVFAQNDAFLNNTAMSYFTKTDWALFNQAQATVLNKEKNGMRVSWRNPETHAHGDLVASAAPSLNGMPCRYVTFRNTAHLINGAGRFRFCKTNHQWKIF